MDFPRPPVDTGFGFHDSASCYWEPHGQHYSYARMLREHGATWYLMWCYDENKADYAKALIDNGIMPIVRLGPAKMPRPGIQMSTVEAYIAAGVKWFMLGNEYNLHEEWTPDDHWKGIDKPIRHVADWYVRIADEVRARGGWPLTPPPSLGGHWLHREWFERFMYALQNIAAEQGRTMKNLLYPGGIGIHCRSAGNPLEDGPEDYDCSAREWERFNDTVVRFVGEELPMCNGEWGDEPGWCRRLHPEFDNRQKWEWWFNRNIEQIKWCYSGSPGYTYPDNVFANCFWVIHDGGTWDDCGMLNNRTYLREMGGSDTTPLWDALPGLITWDEGAPEPPPAPAPGPDPQPQPPAEIEFVGLTEDMIGMLAVTGPDDPSAPYWKVVRVEIQPETNNQSAFAIADMQKRYTANFFWPDGEHLVDSEDDEGTIPEGRVNVASMPLFACWGPYGVEIYGNSEALVGFGLYGDPPDLEITHTAHHPTLVYFQLVEPGEPEPEPLPDDDPYLFKKRLERDAPYGFKDMREQVRAVTGVDMEAVKVESYMAGRLSKSGAPLFNKMEAIVLHHLGREYLGALELVEWAVNDCEDVNHKTNPYHFLIEKSGRILFMVALKYLTHHAYAANYTGIGVCFEDGATEAQMESGRFLIAALEELMGGDWGTHRRLGLMPHFMVWNGEKWYTSCPGKVWPKILRGPWPDFRGSL